MNTSNDGRTASFVGAAESAGIGSDVTAVFAAVELGSAPMAGTRVSAECVEEPCRDGPSVCTVVNNGNAANAEARRFAATCDVATPAPTAAVPTCAPTGFNGNAVAAAVERESVHTTATARSAVIATGPWFVVTVGGVPTLWRNGDLPPRAPASAVFSVQLHQGAFP